MERYRLAIRFAALVILAAWSVMAKAQTTWTLTWSDEFNGPAGSAPDPKKWTYDIGASGWGNKEPEYYTNSRKNSYQDGKGNLVIKAIKESYKGAPYTSARLKTLGLFAHKHGKFEARIKIPYGQGLWPAFWMMGDDVSTTGWPGCGEIDIMENVGKEPATVHGSVHGPGYDYMSPYSLPTGVAFAKDFHVYGIEWDKSEISFYVDGVRYGGYKASSIPAGKKWVFDHPFFFLLNVAVGGNWPGSPDETTVFPQTMLVDYVRVYKAN